MKLQNVISLPAGALVPLLFFFVANSGAQVNRAPAADPAFEVVSFKHTANMNDGSRIEDGRKYFRPTRRLAYKGLRLSGEEILWSYFQFAYSPLVNPWHFEGPPWINAEYYQIEALAPAGTSIDVARAMVRTVLVERLGLQYHLADREAPIYALVRGGGALKLTPATEVEPNPGAMQMGKFIKKSSSLSDFAGFLSGLTGLPVLDKTGIQGQFKFDVDWSREVQTSIREFGGGDPGVALDGVKRLGLKLERRKEAMKIMVVDHINQKPTPN
jgi:uncharacterized protein (TIGR03435 family)